MKRLILAMMMVVCFACTAFAVDDAYKDRVNGINAPVRHAATITPSDTVDLASVPRALWCTEGDITVVFADDTESVTLTGVSGLVPFMVKRLYATGTTSTCVALY